ncbi:diphosphomevalonate decarboxylase [Patescibacteria group bacterium]|nr:diphosphomevalonate decarboxylase [Patescibacteria group bacterium]
MKVTAIANANIALVKYWGKRDERRILPQNSSIGLTTDCLSIKTTVDFSPEHKKDILILNDKEFKKGSEEYDEYFESFLNKLRNLAKKNISLYRHFNNFIRNSYIRNKFVIRRRTWREAPMFVKVVSQSNFPRGAGLASSSAGFAAFAAAANKALGLGFKNKELSILARQGSGSASRSIYDGFVEWKKGERKDGLDSFAEQIVNENYWPDFRMIICLTSKKEKKIKSRTGMAQTVKTSPFYDGWLKTIDDDLKKVRKGIIKRDFSLVGKTAEENCLKMHALMLSTKPPIIYWNSGTIELVHKVIEWRENGLECYFTIDAGPQVKILCLKKDLPEILKRAKKTAGIEDIIVTKPGPGPKIVENHLF